LDQIDEQIAAYLNIPNTHKDEQWGKVQIIESLEEHFADQRVLDFFLSVIADHKDYEMARLHILKYMEIADIPNPTNRQKVGECLTNSFSKEKGWTLRCWFGRAASRFRDIPEVVRAAVDCVLDQNEYADIRINWFQVLVGLKLHPIAIDTLQQLGRLNDDLAAWALDILQKWNLDIGPDGAPIPKQ